MKVKIIFDGAGDWATTWIEEMVVCDCGGKLNTAGGVRHPVKRHERQTVTQIPKGTVLEADLEDGSLRSEHLKRQITPFPSGYQTARILEQAKR